jgi:hypothetical protein
MTQKSARIFGFVRSRIRRRRTLVFRERWRRQALSL